MVAKRLHDANIIYIFVVVKNKRIWHNQHLLSVWIQI